MDVTVRARGMQQWQCIGCNSQGVTDVMHIVCIKRFDVSGWHTDVSWWVGEGMWMAEACGGLADFEKFSTRPYNTFTAVINPLRYCQVATDGHLAPTLHSHSGGTSSTKGPEHSLTSFHQGTTVWYLSESALCSRGPGFVFFILFYSSFY